MNATEFTTQLVQFTGVELKPKGEAAFSRDFTAPKTLDVLALQGTTRAMLLDGAEALRERQWCGKPSAHD